MKLAPRWPAPGPHTGGDPFADEPLLLPGDPEAAVDLGWADYQTAVAVEPTASRSAPLTREAYQAQARSLLDLLDAMERGDADAAGAVAPLLERLRISSALTTDGRTELHIPDTVPTDADLARIAADLCPAAAVEAGDRVLGPLALALDPRKPGPRRALQVALAAYALVVPDGEVRAGADRDVGLGLPPLTRWFRRKPQPPVALRHAFRAIANAPWAPFRLARAHGDDRFTLASLVPLAPRWVPEGPVRLGAAAPLRPPQVGDTLIARLVRGPDGWEVRTPLVLPGGPPAVRLLSWLRLELLRARLGQRKLTVEGLLRERGFVLARRLCEHTWLRGDDDPYANPDLYDLEYRDHDEDLDWYRDLASRHGGPVLELGCGTGRLTLALAHHGMTVRGVDLSPHMLRALQAKLERQPAAVRDRVQLTQGDFRTLQAPPVHPLVLIPFNALHHCAGPEELTAALTRARQALAPGGRVAFDCYLPDLELYDRDPDARYEPRRFVHPATGEPLESWEQGWWDPVARVHHVLYVYEASEGVQRHAHLQLRMFSREEIRAAVQRAGLRLLGEHQDFEGAPLTDDALKYVAVAGLATP